MRQALLSLVLGLVGGFGGALALPHLLPPPDTTPEVPGAARPDPVLLARIADLEAALERIDGGARLEGRAPPRVELADDAVLPEPVIERLEAQLVERLEPRLNEAVEAKFEELAAAADAEGGGRPGRKRMSLEEVAREINLSAAEEDDLRRIYDEATEKLLVLLAGEEGDVEQVKRDFETFQNDESQRPVLMTKYVPKLLTNIGPMMAIEGEKQTQIQEALGDEKAAELGAFDIIEENPFGMQGSVNVSASDQR